ncbi:MAG: hypothetical protein DRI54_01295 [Bacteroidetes bacterium]|nr:MAG: hypothetical protein DRI54_01295 [Bacteroidota bacterium]
MGSLIFTYSSCEITNVDDDICQKKEPLINGTFIVSTKIKYNDGVPYDGLVKFKIYKIYCNGTINGKYEREGNADESGYYSTNYIYTYKYENLRDEVKFYFKINSASEEKKVWYEYSYNAIKSEDANTVNQMFEITLPWDSGEE